MPRALARYRTFFGRPDVARLVLMAFVARMPIGMLSLALLMHLRAATQSFAFAGAVVGAYLVAMAAAAPIQGRIVDRYGPTVLLRVNGVVHTLALIGLWMVPAPWLPQALITVLAMLAGAFIPPIPVLTRTLWRQRFEGDVRRMAFALDSVSIELNYTLGPALIALLLAIASARVALGAAIAFAAAAAPLFLFSPARRYWRVEGVVERHLLGPLTQPQLVRLYACNFALTFGLGLLEVAYPGFSARLDRPAMGGVLIAVNSIGSAIGGIAYGGLHLAPSPERQLRYGLALLSLPIALHALTTSFAVMLPLALVSGLMVAPSFTIVSMLVSQHAPARYATEAFTWSSTGIVAGIGAGMAAGGTIIERVGPASAFVLSAAAMLVAALIASGVRAR
ncbi:MAG TPA: MFS transporter [Casimicrobiaceae bacterium]|nr:MFS transporter [Casimicrobiaceae bacterium]